jgi:pyruvate formate lyase activating enzyme
VVIKGFQPLTLIDYPGKLAAIVFTPGCNFRCPFCYNASLVEDSPSLPVIPTAKIFAYLRQREGLLVGVVVTGGEPTLQPDLATFLREVKSLGYAVKLDSNGSRPQVLRQLLAEKLLDYLALDVKTSLDEAYGEITSGGGEDVLAPVQESLTLLLGGAALGELRTTVVPRFHPLPTLLRLAQQLRLLAEKLGAAGSATAWHWYLQSFQPGRCLEAALDQAQPYAVAEQQKILARLKAVVPQVTWRG